jgi:hypothetical protein
VSSPTDGLPCDDVSVRHFTFGPYNGGVYNVVKADGSKHLVEVNFSPTGRSVTVYVDGKRWKEAS